MAWAPAYGDDDRRKDFSRAKERAQRLRKSETPNERKLWRLLQVLNREQGANFRRQAHIGNRVFDFADLGQRVLIELDGAVHERPDVARADTAKEIDAIVRGYRVLRVTNDDLATDSGAVVRRIHEAALRPSPRRGEGRAGGRSELSGIGVIAAPSSRPLPLPPPPGAGEETDP